MGMTNTTPITLKSIPQLDNTIMTIYRMARFGYEHPNIGMNSLISNTIRLIADEHADEGCTCSPCCAFRTPSAAQELFTAVQRVTTALIGATIAPNGEMLRPADDVMALMRLAGLLSVAQTICLDVDDQVLTKTVSILKDMRISIMLGDAAHDLMITVSGVAVDEMNHAHDVLACLLRGATRYEYTMTCIRG